MTLLRAWLAALPGYLWSGWGALASLFLLLAVWELLAGLYGPLVLPTPLEAANALRQLAQVSQQLWPALLVSARRALAGLALAIGLDNRYVAGRGAEHVGQQQRGPARRQQAAGGQQAFFGAGVRGDIQRLHVIGRVGKYVQGRFAQGAGQRGVGDDEKKGH